MMDIEDVLPIFRHMFNLDSQELGGRLINVFLSQLMVE